MATSLPVPEELPVGDEGSPGAAGHESLPPPLASAARGPTGPTGGGLLLLGVSVLGLLWFGSLNVLLAESYTFVVSPNRYWVTQPPETLPRDPFGGFVYSTPRPVVPYDRAGGDVATAVLVAAPVAAFGVGLWAARRRHGSRLAGVVLLSMAAVLVASGLLLLGSDGRPYCEAACRGGSCPRVPCPADVRADYAYRLDVTDQRATVLIVVGGIAAVAGVVVLWLTLAARHERRARSDEGTASPATGQRSTLVRVVGFFAVMLFCVLPLSCVGTLAAINSGGTTTTTAPTTTTRLPTGTGAPPVSPLPAAPGAGLSMENPLPIGTAIDVEDGWAVQVNSVKTIAYPDPAVSASGILVNVSMRNGSNRVGSGDDNVRFALANPAGVTIGDPCWDVPDKLDGTVDVPAGGSISGNLCFQVRPADAATAVLVADPAGSGDYRFFSLGAP